MVRLKAPIPYELRTETKEAIAKLAEDGKWNELYDLIEEKLNEVASLSKKEKV